MAGKKKVEKETASWVGGIEKNSRQIWLAGVGAYAKAATEGTKAFDALVKEGEKAEKQARADAARLAEAAKASSSAKASASAAKAKAKPLGKWGELEEAFDTRLDTAISRLGVPSRSEVAALNTKVDLLMRELERLTGASLSQAAATSEAKPGSPVVEKKPRVRKPTVKTATTSVSPDAPQG